MSKEKPVPLTPSISYMLQHEHNLLPTLGVNEDNRIPTDESIKSNLLDALNEGDQVKRASSDARVEGTLSKVRNEECVTALKKPVPSNESNMKTEWKKGKSEKRINLSHSNRTTSVDETYVPPISNLTQESTMRVGSPAVKCEEQVLFSVEKIPPKMSCSTSDPSHKMNEGYVPPLKNHNTTVKSPSKKENNKRVKCASSDAYADAPKGKRPVNNMPVDTVNEQENYQEEPMSLDSSNEEFEILEDPNPDPPFKNKMNNIHDLFLTISAFEDKLERLFSGEHHMKELKNLKDLPGVSAVLIILKSERNMSDTLLQDFLVNESDRESLNFLVKSFAHLTRKMNNNKNIVNYFNEILSKVRDS